MKSLPAWKMQTDDPQVYEFIDSIKKFPKDVYGFIYEIVFIDGTRYIGQKALWSTKRVKARKDGKLHPNTITCEWKNTGKGFRQKYDIVCTESDWKKYYGSSKQCKERIPVSREIIDIAYNKYQLTYLEAKYLFFYEVLENDTYLNDNILGSFYRSEKLLGKPE